MDLLTSMRAFVEAVEAGSFAGAAPSLSISPQMIAKHIAALEQRTGARLLNRTTRKQGITEFGETYLAKCRQIIAEVEAADALGVAHRSLFNGRLRVTAPPRFGANKLASFAKRFEEQHVPVKVELVLTERIVDLIDEAVHVAFRIGELPDSGLKAIKIRPHPLVACASPAYLHAHGVPQVPADLKQHRCIKNRYWLYTFGSSWWFEKSGERFDVEVPLVGALPRAGEQRNVALMGEGIVLIGAQAVQDDFKSGDLMKVLPDYEHPHRPMHILFQDEINSNLKVRTFVDLAVAEFAERAR